jgi:hypothetical protein
MKNTFSCSENIRYYFMCSAYLYHLCFMCSAYLYILYFMFKRERERKRMTINVYFDLIKLNYFIGMFTQKKYIPHLNFLVYTQPLKSGIYSLTNKK